MTKRGESGGFKASDFISEIKTYLGNGKIDHVVVSKSSFPEKILKRYSQEMAVPVELDLDKCERLAKNILVRDMADMGNLVRHNPGKIARLIINIAKN